MLVSLTMAEQPIEAQLPVGAPRRKSHDVTLAAASPGQGTQLVSSSVFPLPWAADGFAAAVTVPGGGRFSCNEIAQGPGGAPGLSFALGDRRDVEFPCEPRGDAGRA